MTQLSMERGWMAEARSILNAVSFLDVELCDAMWERYKRNGRESGWRGRIEVFEIIAGELAKLAHQTEDEELRRRTEFFANRLAAVLKADA